MFVGHVACIGARTSFVSVNHKRLAQKRNISYSKTDGIWRSSLWWLLFKVHTFVAPWYYWFTIGIPTSTVKRKYQQPTQRNSVEYETHSNDE